MLIAINDLLDTLYVQQGKHHLARQYVAENRVLESKARIQEQEQKVAALQGRFDTKEKERNIKLLQQQNRIAQLSTLQQRTLRNAALVGAGLLLLLLAVLYNRYRLRQRTVQLLDRQNQEKEVLLREKTLLLQEVHHRVKNNLQIVLSLLSNQLDTQPDPAAAAAIRDSQSRVQTMALIHQNLYQAESLARIDMRRYLAELLDAIGRAFRREEVALTLDVAPVHLTTHAAVPLGLIVNELVTNAYKYAFTGRQHNTLRVELRPLSATTYRLVVADNGIGLPQLDLEMAQSLGLRLTAGLVRQMHAQLTIHRESGTQFHIVFQEATDAAFSSAQPRTPAGSGVPATA
ncbi:sensor histidine kinase [Hymenobacter weizhouensis]|uniref:sensor histidine kinase n=1 Tax=Hymenobacter sp. YIM 151500-1 TaxID=2987689 RepID=UPI002227FA36|nr:sensor histidine kinase [Hymenobacter sp. YIM 151500-1]UYZ63347.1 sensor histidine kinase [Hymenobacter sp. YIM 151500-1]